jgi:hypothetical protein
MLIPFSIISLHLYLGFPNILFPSDKQTKWSLCVSQEPYVYYTSVSRPFLHQVFCNPIKCVEMQKKLWPFPLWNFTAHCYSRSHEFNNLLNHISSNIIYWTRSTLSEFFYRERSLIPANRIYRLYVPSVSLWRSAISLPSHVDLRRLLCETGFLSTLLLGYYQLHRPTRFYSIRLTF